MRVLHLTPYAPPAYAFGGPVRLLETMVAGTLAAGHQVTVATTDVLDHDRRVPEGAPMTPPEAGVVRFPNASHRAAAGAMAWTPRGYRSWVREHARDFDVVHLHDLFSVISVAGARAARAAGVPYVVQPHGSAAVTPERGRELPKRVVMRLWARRTLLEAGAVAAASAIERADLRAWGVPDERIEDLPPPLRLPVLDGRSDLGSPPFVAYLGRLDPIKRVDLLIDAVRRAGLRLVVIGTGPEEARLRALAAGADVDWRGFVSEAEKVRVLQEAHALALLSRSEGLPTAALEAMACRTPVVLSRGCNLPEVHERAGFVVGDDPAEAGAALARLAGDAALRERLAAGAEAFAEPFRAERALPRLLELYEALAR